MCQFRYHFMQLLSDLWLHFKKCEKISFWYFWSWYYSNFFFVLLLFFFFFWTISFDWELCFYKEEIFLQKLIVVFVLTKNLLQLRKQQNNIETKRFRLLKTSLLLFRIYDVNYLKNLKHSSYLMTSLFFASFQVKISFNTLTDWRKL